jgi:hypothetical protein
MPCRGRPPVRLRWPDLTAIIVSGDLEDEESRAGHRDGSWQFLQKPFSFEALATELCGIDGPRDPES